VGHEGHVRICPAKQRDQLFSDGAGQLEGMLLLEFDRVGKPAHRIAERPNRKLNQHLAILGGVIVDKKLLAFYPYLDSKPHEVTFGAVDPAGLELGIEQDIAGMAVA
jgi:hypothetical protein